MRKRFCLWAGILLCMSAAATETAFANVMNLPELVVQSQRLVAPLAGGMVNTTARLGILGNRSIMDIPYTEMSITQKTLETFGDPGQPLGIVLQNNPSIRSSSTSAMYTDFSMRGINMNGNHMMLNGIPSLFYQFNGPPSHIIERMDIVSGPNAGINGVSMSNNGTNSGATPAPGTVNVVTKTAGAEPRIRFTETFSGRSNMAEYIDVSHRFGDRREWGIRVLGEHMDGDLSLKGAGKEERNIFVNLDRIGKTSRTNIFMGHFDLRADEGQRWFTFGGKAADLPIAPDSDIPYDFKGTTKWMYGWLMTVNHEKEINNNWTWFTNFGQSRRSGHKYNSGSALKFNEKGYFMSSNVSNAQNESGKNVYIQTGIRGRFDTGVIHHEVSLAWDRTWAKYWNNTHNSDKGNIFGDLYNGTKFSDNFYIPTLRPATLQWTEVNIGITAADTMTVGKWNLLAALSRKHENFTNNAKNEHFQNDDWLPTFGVSYRANNRLSVYVGQTESVSRGAVVNDLKYANNGATLSPSKSKQKEIGVKYKTGNMLTTLSYFDIDTESLVDVEAGKELYRRADGRDRFQGVELTINGKPAEKWVLTGGVMYLDAKREHTQSGANDGRFVNGSAKWSGVLGAVYEPNAQWELIGRVVWRGEAFIDNSGSPTKKTRIPSYTTLDLGVHYKTKIGETPVTLSAMCYNVTDRDYWMGRGSSTTFGLSVPRTFMISTSLDV